MARTSRERERENVAKVCGSYAEAQSFRWRTGFAARHDSTHVRLLPPRLPPLSGLIMPSQAGILWSEVRSSARLSRAERFFSLSLAHLDHAKRIELGEGKEGRNVSNVCECVLGFE